MHSWHSHSLYTHSAHDCRRPESGIESQQNIKFRSESLQVTAHAPVWLRLGEVDIGLASNACLGSADLVSLLGGPCLCSMRWCVQVTLRWDGMVCKLATLPTTEVSVALIAGSASSGGMMNGQFLAAVMQRCSYVTSRVVARRRLCSLEFEVPMDTNSWWC